jgi:O-antigen ligase
MPVSTGIIGLFPTVVILIAFVLGLRTGVITLILIRPLCDRLFESGRFEVGGSTISYGALVNVVVICAMLYNFDSVYRRVPSGLKAIWLPFLFITFIAIFYSPVQIDGFRRFLTYVTFSGMFMLSFAVVRSENDILKFLKIVILSSVLPALYGLFQTVSGIDMFLDARVHSTFSHPNIFAFYIVMIIGVIFYLMASERIHIGSRFRLVLHGYLIPLLVLLIMTKTRSAWISCFILCFVYGLVYDRRVLILVLIAPIGALAIPAVTDRIMALTTGNSYIGGGANLNAYAWRQLLWANAFTFIWEKPVFGYGLDSFPFYSPTFFPLEPKGTYAHNFYVQFLFETGLVGLLCLLWLFFNCFKWLKQCWRFDRRGLTLAATIIVTFLIGGYSDNLFEYLSFEWCFWFSAGLIFARYIPYNLKIRTFGRRQWIGHQFGTRRAPSRPSMMQALGA